MRYSPLIIYKLVGQYDEVCGVSFKQGSPAYNRYGEYLTGRFSYTKDVRSDLQNRLEYADEADAPGMVQFEDGLDRLAVRDRDSLLREGFYSGDIASILAAGGNFQNAFTQEETRSFPEPIRVSYDSEDWDDLRAFIYLNAQRASLGLQLTPFELDREIAYRFLLNGGQPPSDIPPDHYLDPITGNIRSSIRYYHLKAKDHAKLSPAELADLMGLLEKRSAGDLAILLAELRRSTGQLRTFGVDQSQVKKLIYLLTYFEPERLSLTRMPVWWNADRFLHIFIRHVSEVQIGEHNADKTTFQYRLNDIRRLIQLVLKALASEIDKHFNAFPDKDFRREGRMAIYHAGDYYAIRIAPSGLLMRFHKLGANKSRVKPTAT